MVPPPDMWADVARQIRAMYVAEGGARTREADRALGELWRLAETDGLRILKSFRSQFGVERLRDLIRDYLAANTIEIVFADAPLALFRTAIVRRAISLRERGDSMVVEDLPDHDSGQPTAADAPDERLDTRKLTKVVADALAGLCPRNQAIVVARALGASALEVAEAHGTTRANVDRIVYQFRLKLEALTPEVPC